MQILWRVIGEQIKKNFVYLDRKQKSNCDNSNLKVFYKVKKSILYQILSIFSNLLCTYGEEKGWQQDRRTLSVLNVFVMHPLIENKCILTFIYNILFTFYILLFDIQSNFPYQNRGYSKNLHMKKTIYYFFCQWFHITSQFKLILVLILLKKICNWLLCVIDSQNLKNKKRINH